MGKVVHKDVRQHFHLILHFTDHRHAAIHNYNGQKFDHNLTKFKLNFYHKQTKTHEFSHTVVLLF